MGIVRVYALPCSFSLVQARNELTHVNYLEQYPEYSKHLINVTVLCFFLYYYFKFTDPSRCHSILSSKDHMSYSAVYAQYST